MGFVAGVAVAYALLGREAAPPARTADSGVAPTALPPPSPASGAAEGLPPGAIAPSSDPGLVAAWPTPPAGTLNWPSPSPVPGDSTDHLMDPKAATAPDMLLGERPAVSDFTRLRARALLVPVEGFAVSQLRDNFAERRGTRVHEAIDLLAPRGTPVVAVDDGVVKKLFTSGAGGLTVYQYDPGETYSYYYAHLDRYAEGLAEGKRLKKGDRVGYVGTTGNAPPGTPHLHFTIYKLPADKKWWEGTPINPYPLWALE